MNISEFVAACEDIVTHLGGENALEAQLAKIGCTIPHKDQNVHVYKDEALLVVKSLDSKALLIEKLSNHNPVICRNENGNVYRQHGEWTGLRDHVQQILTRFSSEKS